MSPTAEDSTAGHCLNDLLFRRHSGGLSAEIVAVVSNHDTLRPMAEAAGLPFVLARYMQVLSDRTCEALRGRAINIHQSFLPGFTGAKPYHQAYDRGVELVGATAHHVTADLDEGPIIEQEVIRIDHTPDARALETVGRDAEALALSRGVRWHCERRVVLDGLRTVVLR